MNEIEQAILTYFVDGGVPQGFLHGPQVDTDCSWCGETIKAREATDITGIREGDPHSRLGPSDHLIHKQPCEAELSAKAKQRRR